MEEQVKRILSQARGRFDRLRQEVAKRSTAALKNVTGIVRGTGKRLSRNERLAIVLAIGIIIGYGVKLSLRDDVTIGYQDYTVPKEGATYDLILMQQQLAEQQAEDAMSDTTTDAATVEDAGSCQ